MDETRTDSDILASMIKVELGKVAKHMVNEVIQMYGGIGMTDELDIGLYVKRVQVSN